VPVKYCQNYSSVKEKPRNKIFDKEKKYGLKLSRAIKYEREVEKLQGELGVDVFHIIIEEEELIRKCCS
jgi:hypothetical protein